MNKGLYGISKNRTYEVPLSASFATTASATPNAIITASISEESTKYVIQLTKGNATSFSLNVGKTLPNGSSGEFLFNASGVGFNGTPNLTFAGSPATLRATGSFSGSLVGSLTGTASFATTASYVTGSIFTSTNLALSSSRAVTSSFALTASFVPSSSLYAHVITGANQSIPMPGTLTSASITNFNFPYLANSTYEIRTYLNLAFNLPVTASKPQIGFSFDVGTAANALSTFTVVASDFGYSGFSTNTQATPRAFTLLAQPQNGIPTSSRLQVIDTILTTGANTGTATLFMGVGSNIANCTASISSTSRMLVTKLI